LITLPLIRTIQSAAELEPMVRELLLLRAPKTIWLLEGEVGAGKTETVKTLAKILGLREIASPSFALHHRYEVSGPGSAASGAAPGAGAGAGAGVSVDHLDLYRLESEDDLESTGFWDLFAEAEGLILIEWADRLNWQYLPPDWTKFHLQFEKLENPLHRRVSIRRA
jgi:tRNA threonylcarbamoyladenosine biosynthesis protein TsaE